MIYYSLIVLLMSVLTFLLYGIDKSKAKRSRHRISEKTLLLMALLGGAFGAMLGAHYFSHKRQKLKFKLLNPLFLIFTIGIGIYLYQTGF